jgi:hypothetical protein
LRRDKQGLDLNAWRRYVEANARARERYEAVKHTIDAQYNVVNRRERPWYERDVAELNPASRP